ncbi:hypothetical protein QE422_001675 [Chryseobacterium sp. SORGH_AS 447]|nr:hypothetical protein [Chryseobacterium sp. SORGH_AS_0447]
MKKMYAEECLSAEGQWKATTNAGGTLTIHFL